MIKSELAAKSQTIMSPKLFDLEITLVGQASPLANALVNRLVDAGLNSSRIDLKSIESFDDQPCDVVIPLCLTAGGLSRDEVLRCVASGRPVVVVFDEADDSFVRGLLEQGAQDCLSYQEAVPSTLRRVVQHAFERHAMRRELFRRNERLRTLIESNVDGLLVLGTDGNILFANQAVTQLLGRPAESLVGCDFGFPVVTDEHTEIELRTSDGETRTAELRVAEMQWEDRDAWIVSLRDVTERKIAEENARTYRRHVERLTSDLIQTEERERRRLARVLHDDLQQTLVALRMTIEFAGDKSGADGLREDLQEGSRLVSEAIRTTRSLTAELTPTILDDLGLASALEWLCRLQRQRFGLSVEMDSDDGIFVHSEDLRSFLFQATRELLFNTVKHAKGASVRVRLDRTKTNDVRIVVEDNGPGFDVEQLDRNDRNEGGFGLFSVRQRIEQFNGVLGIESEPGAGTRFTITVPNPSNEQTAPPASQPEPTSESALKVVLIDDSHAVRRMFSKLLAREPGLNLVAVAANGEEGLREVAQARPDVVLTDFTLPDMTGIEVIKALHEQHPDLRIIGISMHEPEDVAEPMITAGADCYLRKDLPMDEIVRVILSGNRIS